MNGLEGLKKGDDVVLIHRGWGSTVNGGFRVGHVTPTLIVSEPFGSKDDVIRVRIATGKRVGDDRFSGTSYYASTDPYVAAVRKAKAETVELQALKDKFTQAISGCHDKPSLLATIKEILDQHATPAIPATSVSGLSNDIDAMHVTSMGKTFKVVALRTTVSGANAFCANHPGAGVLSNQDGVIIIAENQPS